MATEKPFVNPSDRPRPTAFTPLNEELLTVADKLAADNPGMQTIVTRNRKGTPRLIIALPGGGVTFYQRPLPEEEK